MSGKIPRGGEGKGPAFSPARSIVWGLIFTVGIPIALLGSLHLPAVQGVVIDTLIRKIEGGTGLKISVENHTWWPLSQLDLEKVSIRAPEGEIFHCDKAGVTYALSLWRPFVHPEEIRLENPVIHVERDERHRWRIPVCGTGHERSGKGAVKESSKRQGASRFKMKFVGGTVLGRMHGDQVLTIRNISGTVPFLLELGEDGPALEIDLGELQKEHWLPGPLHDVERGLTGKE